MGGGGGKRGGGGGKGDGGGGGGRGGGGNVREGEASCKVRGCEVGKVRGDD